MAPLGEPSGRYADVLSRLRRAPARWLVTGAAGFIGSNLVETLLANDQHVVGLDDFATGHRRNLEGLAKGLSDAQRSRFTFIEGDIRDLSTCRSAVEGIDHVLHQAALGSVPRSLADPITTNAVNIDGFLNMMVAARDAAVKSFTYAASSSTYGDHPDLPKREDVIGNPLSPYAVTKRVDELYADVFARSYGFASSGLRYFNVFGKRQDPEGAYAAVIPRWIAAMIDGRDIQINGDGQTSRDFCYVDNVVQANILAATAARPGSAVYNIGVGGRTTLLELFAAMRSCLAAHGLVYDREPVHAEARAGDVRHSQADVSRAVELLGYAPTFDVGAGLERTIAWYLADRR